MARQKTLHEKLRELGNNLWWSWQPEVTQIFRDIDPTLWTEVGHNPVLLLEQYPPETLEKRATEAVLHTRINWAYRRWQEYMQAIDTWGATHAGVLGHRPTAYFSAEFGVHESLPIYSGGLGVLAGDHLKSASDQLPHSEQKRVRNLTHLQRIQKRKRSDLRLELRRRDRYSSPRP